MYQLASPVHADYIRLVPYAYQAYERQQRNPEHT